ncbi:hypothetical protein [Wenzhouxiangella sp. EGI_FJ10305]|uniref:hypothetical protein n=1 Tax=Wenzhouxiangella sp. EGI_FJ10305 TaxID=3243768 RepID=UPI0035D72D3B
MPKLPVQIGRFEHEDSGGTDRAEVATLVFMDATAKRRVAHALTDEMEEAGLFVANQLAARAGHARPVEAQQLPANPKTSASGCRRTPKEEGCAGFLIPPEEIQFNCIQKTPLIS